MTDAEKLLGIINTISLERKVGIFDALIIFSEENNIEINCKTEEAAHFLKKYAFVILGGLKQYFPALKKLKVNCESSFW